MTHLEKNLGSTISHIDALETLWESLKHNVNIEAKFTHVKLMDETFIKLKTSIHEVRKEIYK